jgi:hypothetical protein
MTVAGNASVEMTAVGESASVEMTGCWGGIPRVGDEAAEPFGRLRAGSGAPNDTLEK